MEKNLKNQWNTIELIEHLEDLHNGRNKASRALLALNTLRQGLQQLLRKFNAVFGLHYYEADNLVPTSCLKGLPYVKYAHSISPRCSYKSHDLFDMKAQDLAINEL